MKEQLTISEFRNVQGIEYFDFEEDFVEENMRCIPMIVRFKMDAAGIKLKLSEWSKFKTEERIELALKPASGAEETKAYHIYLSALVEKYTGANATALAIAAAPEWANLKSVPSILVEKMNALDTAITTTQWEALSDLQRFALVKLCRSEHENKNLPAALSEFGLTNN